MSDALIKRRERQMNFNRDKKVVVVYGDAGTGKTTALCMLCKSLISRCLVGWFVLQKKRDKNRLTMVPKNRTGAHQDVLCSSLQKSIRQGCDGWYGNPEGCGEKSIVISVKAILAPCRVHRRAAFRRVADGALVEKEAA